MEVWKSQTWSICWRTVQLHYLCRVLYKLVKAARPLTCLSADLAQAFSLHIFPKLRLNQSLKAGLWRLATWAMGKLIWFWVGWTYTQLTFLMCLIIWWPSSSPTGFSLAEKPHGCKSRHPAQHMAGFPARAPQSHWGRRRTAPDGLSNSIGMIRLQQSLQLCGEKEKRFRTELQQ